MHKSRACDHSYCDRFLIECSFQHHTVSVTNVWPPHLKKCLCATANQMKYLMIFYLVMVRISHQNLKRMLGYFLSNMNMRESTLLSALPP